MKINPTGKRDLARERQFVKLWNAGTPIPEIMRLMDYTAEDSVHCRAQDLRAKGYSLRMGRFRRRTPPRKPRNFPGEDLDTDYGPPCKLYDAEGKVIGEMDPCTREKSYHAKIREYDITPALNRAGADYRGARDRRERARERVTRAQREIAGLLRKLAAETGAERFLGQVDGFVGKS